MTSDTDRLGNMCMESRDIGKTNDGLLFDSGQPLTETLVTYQRLLVEGKESSRRTI